MNPGSESQWIQSVSWGNWVQGRNTTWMGQIITGHYTYSFPPRGNLGDMWLWSTNSTCCCAIRNANCDAEQMLTLISDCFPLFWAQKLYENLSQPKNLYINRAGCKACSFRLAIPNTWRQHWRQHISSRHLLKALLHVVLKRLFMGKGLDNCLCLLSVKQHSPTNY